MGWVEAWRMEGSAKRVTVAVEPGGELIVSKENRDSGGGKGIFTKEDAAADEAEGLEDGESLGRESSSLRHVGRYGIESWAGRKMKVKEKRKRRKE